MWAYVSWADLSNFTASLSVPVHVILGILSTTLVKVVGLCIIRGLSQARAKSGGGFSGKGLDCSGPLGEVGFSVFWGFKNYTILVHSTLVASHFDIQVRWFFIRVGKTVFITRSELGKVLFLALSVTSVCVWNISRNCWTDLRQIHTEDVFGPSLGWVWRSKSISAAWVRFMFGKTSAVVLISQRERSLYAVARPSVVCRL